LSIIPCVTFDSCHFCQWKQKKRIDLKRIRILIADDHALVRAGIRALLEKQPNMEAVAEASNGREAIGLVRQLQPDEMSQP